MEFPQCKVKSVKADIVAGEISIAFTLKLNDDSLEAAEALSMYVDKDQGKVEVRVIPDQPLLKGLEPVPAETAGAESDDE
jgi:ribosomal protein L16/L10AE